MRRAAAREIQTTLLGIVLLMAILSSGCGMLWTDGAGDTPAFHTLYARVAVRPDLSRIEPLRGALAFPSDAGTSGMGHRLIPVLHERIVLRVSGKGFSPIVKEQFSRESGRVSANLLPEPALGGFPVDTRPVHPFEIPTTAPRIIQPEPQQPESISVLVPTGTDRLFEVDYVTPRGEVLGEGSLRLDLAGAPVEVNIQIVPGVAGILLTGVRLSGSSVLRGDTVSATATFTNETAGDVAKVQMSLRLIDAVTNADASTLYQVVDSALIPTVPRLGFVQLAAEVKPSASNPTGRFRVQPVLRGTTAGGVTFVKRTGDQAAPILEVQ